MPFDMAYFFSRTCCLAPALIRTLQAIREDFT